MRRLVAYIRRSCMSICRSVINFFVIFQKKVSWVSHQLFFKFSKIGFVISSYAFFLTFQVFWIFQLFSKCWKILKKSKILKNSKKVYDEIMKPIFEKFKKVDEILTKPFFEKFKKSWWPTDRHTWPMYICD